MSLWQPRFSHTVTPGFSHTGTPGFSSLFRMLDDFERYAGQQLGGTQGSTSVATFSPKFDVTEREKEYVKQRGARLELSGGLFANLTAPGVF